MMKINKNMIIALTITFCFIASMLMVIPIRSQSSGQYDPWLDINDDGRINMDEIVAATTAFGSTGDPTKNVNVTNPKAMTIQEDLNLSISSGLAWTSSIDPFATAGYDRMFVSAAVIDISNYSSSIGIIVSLVGVNWYWGLAKGKYLITTIYPYDYSRQVNINIPAGFASYIPVSCDESGEFPVEAGQCSLSFNGTSSHTLQYGWVMIRVWIYLTVGTTSPPAVQNTYVTNMPDVQPQPSSATELYGFNSSINGGYGGSSLSVYLGGYSRMFLSIGIDAASYYGVPVQTTVSLTNVRWSDSGFEYVPPDVLNATYYGTYLPVYSQQVPPEFKTKYSTCTLYFNIQSGATSGWIEFYVRIYLRNE
jgi:hypothetical protein